MAPTAAPVTVRAPAKVNLVLRVGRPRHDGFHPLNTVYQAISLYDDVRVEDAGRWQVSVTPLGDVDCSTVPLDQRNLAVRAGQALAAHHGLRRAASIEIGKGIPVAGGLAGGSADAAATLVALDRLWDLHTPDDELLALAAELGSDVPFSLLGGTAHGTGRGEQVVPVPDAGSHWWVVVPDATGLSTPAVYREFDRLHPDVPLGSHVADPVGLLAALRVGDVPRVGAALTNDLEEPALSLRPELAERCALVRSHHDGPVLLSGSGPTLLAHACSHEAATATRLALLEAGVPVVHVATGPVAGAHVVELAG
ncbi:4-diphosphocytidyl-2-C-methyl-D-erythritol kinase [Nocardioides scoriae]|uniref:4-diphosphocytidyl-2-C-methyl-D-erythritol kinase n=1 Tax=Nocardioides scoriae TaxID=642780 RepID=A0A1H1S275_9ACTN|nr:4-(cytidine 5'-diphospho)-2-C-methyl-D-erythritol kinase [Nocardioides scoriae]SDS41299.1 4-diphosphocytidyl-2-C-methyl-D-erythritol kinase [Nocardioides scoriae]